MLRHFIPRNDNRVVAFTLAEVLITLTIIGVIAALTIPNLMHKYQDFVYKTAYKKAYSDINNALDLIKAEENIEPIDYDTFNIGYRDIFKQIAVKLKAVKTCYEGSNVECWERNGESATVGTESNNWRGSETVASYSPAFIDSSGRGWYMYYHSEAPIIYDFNGKKGPNQLGKDRIPMMLNYNTKTNNWHVTYFYGDHNQGTWCTPGGCRWCPSGKCYYRSWLYK